jgi:hypothetical protein
MASDKKITWRTGVRFFEVMPATPAIQNTKKIKITNETNSDPAKPNNYKDFRALAFFKKFLPYTSYINAVN